MSRFRVCSSISILYLYLFNLSSNKCLEESDAPWEPEPDQEDYEEVAKFLLEAGKYELGIDLCGRMVKKYGYKLTPELVGLVREAAEKEPKFLAMAVKVLG